MIVAVVDGFSSGRHVVRELRKLGAECAHVRSSPRLSDYYEATFQPQDYAYDLGYDPDPAAAAGRLRSLGAEYVVPGTESGVELADVLAGLTGLPGNAPGLSGARRSKFLMSEALAQAGLDHPRSILVKSPEEAAAWFADAAPPTGAGLGTAAGSQTVVVKPVDSAGSDRVRICRTAARAAEAAAEILSANNLFGHANETAVVQEFLEGPEFYVNTVTVDGRHHVVETWQYTKSRSPEGAPLFDFEEPVDPSRPEAKLLRAYVCSALTALGVRTGAAHSEVVLTARGPVMIDPGARLGGGVLPQVSADLTGHSHASLLALSIVAPATFERVPLPLSWDDPVRYVSLINHGPGHSRTTQWSERIAGLPTAAAVAALPPDGAFLPRTTDLLTSPGFVYLTAEPEESGADGAGRRSAAQIERDYAAIRAWEREALYTG